MASKIGCAFNYSGSKIRHKNIVESILPKEDNLSVLDLFYGAGSLTSTLNPTWSIIANDLESRLMDIHIMLRKLTWHRDAQWLVEELVSYGKMFIKDKNDREGYLAARDYYNNMPDTLLGEMNKGKVMLLYILLCSSFSNQLRWCDQGNWNIPHGLRNFNRSMQNNLLRYIVDISKRDMIFTSQDFRSFNLPNWDLVISDCPYLKTTASYNESGGWTLKDSVALMTKLGKYHDSGGKFIMFEESFSKGVENTVITSWMRNYNVTILGDSSAGSNYQRKSGKTVELMIHNF